MTNAYFNSVIAEIKSMRLLKNIKTLTIIDQTNSLVAECRDFNSGYEKNEIERHRISIKLDETLTAVRKIVHTLSPIIFNSSINIERELMRKSYITGNKSLDFGMEHDGVRLTTF